MTKPLVLTPAEFRRIYGAARMPSRAEQDAAYERGRNAYVRTHWGTPPKANAPAVAYAPNPFLGDLVELGALVAVEYLTEKDEVAVYRHTFNRKALPILSYREGRPAQGGGLVLCGGTYRVTTRGIEG